MRQKLTYLWNNEADAKQAMDIIKAERARVRRLVRKLRDRYLIPRTVYQEACDDILNALKEGR